MEKALLITPSEADSLLSGPGLRAPAVRRAPGRVLPGYSTLVVGSEFCQNQVPSVTALKKLAHNFPDIKLSLATSILTDSGLLRWDALFSALRGKQLIGEVIVNDWGLFPVLKKNGPFKLSSGRLLTRELTGTDRLWAAAFVKKHGLSAAEVDEPAQAAAAAELGLAISWHSQLVFKAVTTFCPFEKHFKPSCARSCDGELRSLSNRLVPFPLLLSEKAYFSPLRKGGGRIKHPWRKVSTKNFLKAVPRGTRCGA